MLPGLIFLLVFFAAFLLFIGIAKALLRKRFIMAERLEDLTINSSKPQSEARKINRSITWESILRWGGKLLASVKAAEKVEKSLERADIPLRGGEFLFLSLTLGLGAFFVIWLFSQNFVLALCGFLCFICGPWLYLKQRQQKRLHILNDQLNDCLSVMANALRAGYSFLQTLEMVVRETPPPLSSELGRALREMQLGTETEVALSNLSKRVGSEDLELLITALLIQRQVGGNLVEILDNIAETIRERVRIQGEIRSLTAQGRISGLVVGLLPVVLAVILFLINPSYISVLFTEKIGLILLFCAVIGEFLGVVIVRHIVDIKV